jgi:U3 small nucleolar RNA-associated protein 21
MTPAKIFEFDFETQEGGARVTCML